MIKRLKCLSRVSSNETLKKRTRQSAVHTCVTLLHFYYSLYHSSVLSKVDDFATFKEVEVHAENSTF